jgi:DNA mismatch repair protein MutS2
MKASSYYKISIKSGIFTVHRKKDTPVSNEVHLRQLTVDEAMIKLDKYLNDAFMAGLTQVKVIHGKGTGTIRQAARGYLSRHPLVKSHRAGDYGEGGDGVTIAELA